MNKITPVILCGGSGSRLWPLSRATYPKQLLPLVNDKSLLQQTLLRVNELAQTNPPIVICNQDYRFIVAEQIRDLGLRDVEIILETEGRNTAPAVTLAALRLQALGRNDFMLVLPADHVIQNHDLFMSSVKGALKIAEENKLLTFGVNPTKPETGYGYIQKGQALPQGGFQVKQFVEKPDFKTAQTYLDSGDYFWNSGIFLFSVKTYLQEMEQHAPDIVAACRVCVREIMADLDFHRMKPESFHACRSESLDYALMEKSQNIAVFPLNSDWSDMGAWSALWEVNPADAAGNILKGDVVTEQVNNSYLHAESRLLTAVGVSDLVIVETADAVLVAHKDRCQEVKHLVNTLKSNQRAEVERHRRDYRPWGYYEILSKESGFQAKRLVIKPGAKLSLQVHQHRSEHWVVIRGCALVTCGEKKFELKENESTFISAGIKHRLENTGVDTLELIEIQTGSYFGEDDIVRFEDLYQRSKSEAEETV